jgi:hypothetical protein
MRASSEEEVSVILVSRRFWITVALAASALLVAASIVTVVLVGAGGQGSAATAAPQRDSIRVHGRWTIQIRTPTGHLVTQRRFENLLVGADVLAQLLTRQKSLGNWRVQLTNDVQADRPCFEPNNGIPFPCVIQEPGNSGGEPWESDNLALSYDSSTQAFVLSGSINANRTGQVGRVETRVFLCNPTNPPSGCLDRGFTSKLLSPAVAVQNGQQISVTVQITFS